MTDIAKAAGTAQMSARRLRSRGLVQPDQDRVSTDRRVGKTVTDLSAANALPGTDRNTDHDAERSERVYIGYGQRIHFCIERFKVFAFAVAREAVHARVGP